MTYSNGLHFNNLRGTSLATLLRAVVALAPAFGASSGAGPVAGLHGAIFVGLIASLFGGTPALDHYMQWSRAMPVRKASMASGKLRRY